MYVKTTKTVVANGTTIEPGTVGKLMRTGAMGSFIRVKFPQINVPVMVSCFDVEDCPAPTK